MPRLSFDPIFEAAADLPVRSCDHPGCIAGGEYRAPKSRLDLHDYYWFCLEHVRAYNSAWNYYVGMSDAEIEAEIRHDTVWQRPTWRLGDRHGPAYAERIRDLSDVPVIMLTARTQELARVRGLSSGADYYVP